MDKKKYPTRMHEVLGVETGEVFTVMWNDTKKDFSLDGFGVPEDIETEDIGGIRYPASGLEVVYMINHPERIIRKPRPTQEQVEQLQALVTLGYRWLIKDSTDAVFAYVTRPVKQSEWWNCGGANVRIFIDLPPGILTSLVYWSDPEPLDIVATLKAAGVEVEE